MLEAKEFISKLSDPLLAAMVAVSKHTSVHKKVTDALSPAKVQLLTTGDALQAMASGVESETDEATILLKELRELDERMTIISPLIQALGDNRLAARFLVDALDACKIANIPIADTLRETVVKRGSASFFDNGEYEKWVGLMSCDECSNNELLKYNIHWACGGNEKNAAAMQDAQVMTRVVEAFRSVNLTDEAAAIAKLLSFISALKTLRIASPELQVQIGDLVIVGTALDSNSDFVGEVEAVRAAKDRIVKNPAHRLQKTITLLPGGNLLTSKLTPALEQHDKDVAGTADLDKCLELLKQLPVFKMRENEKEADNILIPDKSKYEETAAQHRLILTKVSQAFQDKNKDKLEEISQFFEGFSASIRNRIHLHNYALMKVAIANFSRCWESNGKSVSMSDVNTALVTAKASLKGWKSFQLSAILSESNCNTVDIEVALSGGQRNTN